MARFVGAHPLYVRVDEVPHVSLIGFEVDCLTAGLRIFHGA